jgi:fumarylacetoacetate (FAA) hydrolase
MKLATLKDGSRDGQLAVVSSDLTRAHFAAGIATTLQQALDDWNFIAPQLQDLAVTLEHGKARHAFPFDPLTAMAPLPRAGHCALQLLGAGDTAAAFWPADALWGPADPLRLPAAAGDAPAPTAWLAPGLTAVCGDIERGTPADAAPDGVRLLLATAACLVQTPDRAGARPLALACAAVAVTPDELGPAWAQGGLHWSLADQAPAAMPDTGAATLGPLIAGLARWRPLRAGALVGWRLPLPDEAAGLPGALALPAGGAGAPAVVVHGADGRGPLFGPLALRLLPSPAQG